MNLSGKLRMLWADKDGCSDRSSIMPLVKEAERSVIVPLEVARLIDGAFLPLNPNKLRSASPEVVDAAKQFKQAIADTQANIP